MINWVHTNKECLKKGLVKDIMWEKIEELNFKSTFIKANCSLLYQTFPEKQICKIILPTVSLASRHHHSIISSLIQKVLGLTKGEERGKGKSTYRQMLKVKGHLILQQIPKPQYIELKA